MGMKSKAKEELWFYVRQQFLERGIPLVPANGGDISIVPDKGR
jgi:hypothetical protein